jgi:signal transduction histidine kinase
MTLSIRARLTLWYCTVVVIVLVTGAAVGLLAQSQRALQRLDDDLARSMATLEGVMRTEFAKGMSLEEAAAEASSDVVVLDRTVVLRRRDGTLVEVWGLPFDRAALPEPSPSPIETRRLPAGEWRIINREVTQNGHAYVAAIMAPMAPLAAQRDEMVRAMSLGVVFALLVAAIGGWLIGRQTLRPLTRMADQARRINPRNPRERLADQPVADELGRLGASFNELLDRIAAGLDVQRQFMADASHELRTPVSVVRTTTQVTLAQEVRSPGEYRESLTIIGEQAARLAKLVDAMFLLSRAEAQGIPLTPEFLNLDDLVAECVRAARVLADQRGVAVVTTGAEEVGLTGDDLLLRQMVGNLLDNAIRHAQPGGQVTADLERSDHQVVLRVTNDGPGIAHADRERVFERFVRLGSSNGAGLGLPIARWIAEAHGGTVSLERSQPGQTTFVATLPLDAAADTPSIRRDATVPIASSTAPA